MNIGQSVHGKQLNDKVCIVLQQYHKQGISVTALSVSVQLKEQEQAGITK